jgi:hypothetical protein
MGGILQLNGETTHVRHNLFNTVDNYRNNLDISPFVSMDTTYRVKPVQYFTDGTNNVVISSYNYNNGTRTAGVAYDGNFPSYWTKINTNAKDLATSGYLSNKQAWGDGSSSNGSSNTANANFAERLLASGYGGTNAWPVYRNPATNNLVWISQVYYSGNAPGALIGSALATAFSATPVNQAPSGGVNQNYSGQLVGVSKLDFNTIQIHNAVSIDGVNTISKSNVSESDQTLSPQKLLSGNYDKEFNFSLLSQNNNSASIVMMPIDKRKNFQKVTLVIDKLKSALSSATILDKSNNITFVKVVSINFGAVLADQLFLFNRAKYPKNVEIFD